MYKLVLCLIHIDYEDSKLQKTMSHIQLLSSQDSPGHGNTDVAGTFETLAFLNGHQSGFGLFETAKPFQNLAKVSKWP